LVSFVKKTNVTAFLEQIRNMKIYGRRKKEKEQSVNEIGSVTREYFVMVATLPIKPTSGSDQ
jgi:hypothetical protein